MIINEGYAAFYISAVCTQRNIVERLIQRGADNFHRVNHHVRCADGSHSICWCNDAQFAISLEVIRVVKVCPCGCARFKFQHLREAHQVVVGSACRCVELIVVVCTYWHHHEFCDVGIGKRLEGGEVVASPSPAVTLAECRTNFVERLSGVAWLISFQPVTVLYCSNVARALVGR